MAEYVPSNAFKILYPSGEPIVDEVEGYPLNQLVRADFVGFEFPEPYFAKLVFQLKEPPDA